MTFGTVSATSIGAISRVLKEALEIFAPGQCSARDVAGLVGGTLDCGG
jgi:hypothetical protein